MRRFVAVLAVVVMPAPAFAIAFVPPRMVGPVHAQCQKIVVRGLPGRGRDIPFAALSLGMPVVRATTSFPTGGSGSANMMLAEQRRRAGLQFEAMPFDGKARVPLRVFAQRVRNVAVYQRLTFLGRAPLLAGDGGLIAAVPTSPTTASIAALALVLSQPPRQKPLVRLACSDGRSIAVHSTTLTADQAVRLVRGQYRPTQGRVLFVSSADEHEHEWVDYGLLHRSRKRGPD